VAPTKRTVDEAVCGKELFISNDGNLRGEVVAIFARKGLPDKLQRGYIMFPPPWLKNIVL